MSLLNWGAGLSAMGGAISSFAGAAAMSVQKADLEKQTMTLADQLATAREHTGRLEAADIATTAAERRAEVEKDLESQREGSTKEIEGLRTASSERLAGTTLAETHRHNLADEDNSATVMTVDDDGMPASFDKRTKKITPLHPDAFKSTGLINAKPSSDSSQGPLAKDPMVATDRSPERRPWLTPTAPASDPALVYKGDVIGTLPLEGQAKFASLSPARQLQLGPLLAGDIAPPESGRAMTDPDMKILLRQAALVDPTFTEQTWRARNKAVVDLADTKTPGSSGGQRVAARTFLGHATDLLQAAADKNNTSDLGTIGNWIDNTAVNHTPSGAPGNSTAKKTIQNQFGISREGVAEELGKIISGGTPTVDQRKVIADQFGDEAEVSSVAGAVGEAADMMAKRIQSQVDSYNKTMRAHETLEGWLGPEAYKQYQTLSQIAADSKSGKPIDDASVQKALAAIKAGPTTEGQAPAGVDPTTWQHMTPEERKLFQ